MPQKSGHSRKLGVNHCLPSGCWQHPRSLSLESRHIRSFPPDEKRANKHQRPWRAQSEPMKSSLLSHHTDMKASVSFERERRNPGELNESPVQKKMSLSTTGTTCRRLRFGWRLMHIFDWFVLSASDQSGPEGGWCFFMCERASALFLERTSQGALDSRRLQNPSRLLLSCARGGPRSTGRSVYIQVINQ